MPEQAAQHRVTEAQDSGREADREAGKSSSPSFVPPSTLQSSHGVCLNCGQSVKHTPGKKKRVYCSDKCRVAHYRSKVRKNKALTSPTIDERNPTYTKLPPNYGLDNCQCMHCQLKRLAYSDIIINHGERKPAHLLGPREVNRVILQGDVDYAG